MMNPRSISFFAFSSFLLEYVDRRSHRHHRRLLGDAQSLCNRLALFQGNGTCDGESYAAFVGLEVTLYVSRNLEYTYLYTQSRLSHSTVTVRPCTA